MELWVIILAGGKAILTTREFGSIAECKDVAGRMTVWATENNLTGMFVATCT